MAHPHPKIYRVPAPPPQVLRPSKLQAPRDQQGFAVVHHFDIGTNKMENGMFAWESDVKCPVEFLNLSLLESVMETCSAVYFSF